ncbi:hypothetical protein W02_20150 [Nitrospira sp. KM1]|uniref:hypothetical protein n=1 Tax=Nitrospira sp. KM1 TaxID=1936990 RepID=UPI0013A72E19|nr:hypothetical protein [Nitrospira sp. KM1]BCA54875.1 hypothetical protein W02_20150 [Nitrospira sp. KM1]
MRIRKKTPKPSAKRPPLYFIGYRGTAPQADELCRWYDLEYGGPLSLKTEDGAPESWQITHSPWTAHVVIPLPSTHTTGLKEQLAWEHDSIGAVAPTVMPPRDMPDSILFAARVARGLTLLTQGTAYDVTTQQYLNPSDWKDRGLNGFVIDDHVMIAQNDQSQPDQVWWYTLGLSKFGMDELEAFQPVGLSERGSKELLAESSYEMIRIGQSPKVGAAFRLPVLGRTIRIVNYRTAAPLGRVLSFREIQS